MTEATVLVRDDGPVRTLTFNRPARLNAWTFEMGDRYFDLLDEAGADPDVRVIVVTGPAGGSALGWTRTRSRSRPAGSSEFPARAAR